MDLKHIRNFSIIAHIDHGKSTLADRMLEITKTVEKRKMRDRVLDDMELEQERGITIKMRPVRMNYESGGENFELNLIDTPGHIDFSYEVSRAIKAVEGSLLLVDATQGVQAQTLSTLQMARDNGLVIIPVLSKIDSPLARIEDVKEEIVELLDCDVEDIVLTSGKTGEGVDKLLEAIVRKIPCPKSKGEGGVRALVFDFQYSSHTGVIVYVRMLDGSIKRGDDLLFKIAGERFIANDVGLFRPEATVTPKLDAGEIGYVITGIKKPGVASVGDTITGFKRPESELAGYMSPKPMVWASIYPESQDDLNNLRTALDRLRLTDSSYTFEEESSGTLGRGFRCGFLGMLHLEIITERLKREFNLRLIITTPTINYEVTDKKGNVYIVYNPSKFPEHGDLISVREPWVLAKIILPMEYLSPVMQLLFDHEGRIKETDNFGHDRTVVNVEMPLREFMRGFFDEMKSVSSGYASISYEMQDMRPADVCRLDILVAGEVIAAFTRVVAKRRVNDEAEKAVKRLANVLPRQMFTTKIQGQALGRIISSETLSALKKDAATGLSGGDITRKMKLREKQKEGRQKLKERGKVNIPHEVFLKMVKE